MQRADLFQRLQMLTLRLIAPNDYSVHKDSRAARIPRKNQLVCGLSGLSLGVIQLVHLSPRQRRGFFDSLLAREGVAAEPKV